MGSGYKKTCKKCGFEFNSFTGVGYMYPSVYTETVQKAKDGELGKELQNFFNEHADGAIDTKNVILCCEKCGHLDNDMDLTMYIPKTKKTIINTQGKWSIAMPFKDTYYASWLDLKDYYKEFAKYPHRCEKCGGKMKILKENAKLKCPKCKVTLNTEKSILWD